MALGTCITPLQVTPSLNPLSLFATKTLQHADEIILFASLYLYGGPGYLSGYSDWLRAGRSWDRIPVETSFFRTRPDRPWGPPSLLYNGYRVFPWG